MQFCEEFQTWRPNIYVFVEGGVIQGASASCDMSFELFDTDNEKEELLDEEDLTYEERLKEWNENIAHGHESGKLKPIF